MDLPQLAVWSVILGLSLMFIGGLVLWTYGNRQPAATIATSGLEAEATKKFHTRLIRWFFIYGFVMILLGLAFFAWGSFIFF